MLGLVAFQAATNKLAGAKKYEVPLLSTFHLPYIRNPVPWKDTEVFKTRTLKAI